jgi:hypothetical protein
MNNFVIAMYDLAASFGMIFLVFVIGQTMNDAYHKRTDAAPVQTSRKITFFSGAAYLLLTIYFQDLWLVHPTVISVGLVATMMMIGLISILSVSVVSLKSREPPKEGGRVSHSAIVERVRIRRW